VVALSIDNEEKLQHLYEKLLWRGANVTQFSEPDIGDQMTSLCFLGTPELIKNTNNLKLALS